MKLLKYSKKKKADKRVIQRKKYTRVKHKRKVGQHIGSLKVLSRRYSTFFRHMLIVFIFFSTVYALYQVLFVSSLFKIQKITLKGDSLYVNLSDLGSVVEGASLGKNLFSYRTQRLNEALQKGFLAAETFHIRKRLPNRLEVSVVERRPVAVIEATLAEEHYIVDGEGFVLGIADASFDSFPRITYNEDVLVGRFLDRNNVPLSLEIIDAGSANDLEVENIEFVGKYIALTINPGIDVKIRTGANIDESMRIVGTMIKTHNLEGKNISLIDLRYDKVVVSY